MTAFLKIDRCTSCRLDKPWEWVPAVVCAGKVLAGTAVWRSQLLEGICHTCRDTASQQRQEDERTHNLREATARLLGGEKPYREFTFESYDVTPGNQNAFDAATRFSPSHDNLYFWGPCGVGKTHLAFAIARRSIEQGITLEVLKSPQLVRKLRMKDPDSEQAVIDRLANVGLLVLDDLGMGTDTAYGRQVLQEILDARLFRDRGGLVTTSKYSLSMLAERMQDDTIPSRLAGMCRVVAVVGKDRRLVSGP